LAQSGSAPGLGPGGRKFESCSPDHIYFIKTNTYKLISLISHLFATYEQNKALKSAVFGANQAGFHRVMSQHLQTPAEERLSGLMSEAFVYVNFACSIGFAIFALLFIHLVLK
jgi:hypothetical protein